MFTARIRMMSHAGSQGEVLLAARLADHSACVVLSHLFRGKLCEDLARGPVRRLAAGEFV
jgi:hypothetical protein